MGLGGGGGGGEAAGSETGGWAQDRASFSPCPRHGFAAQKELLWHAEILGHINPPTVRSRPPEETLSKSCEGVTSKEKINGEKISRPRASAEVLTVQTGRKVWNQTVCTWDVQAEISSRPQVGPGSGKVARDPPLQLDLQRAGALSGLRRSEWSHFFFFFFF